MTATRPDYRGMFVHFTGLLDFALEHGYYHDTDLTEEENAELYARGEELELQLHRLAFPHGDSSTWRDERRREPGR